MYCQIIYRQRLPSLFSLAVIRMLFMILNIIMLVHNTFEDFKMRTALTNIITDNVTFILDTIHTTYYSCNEGKKIIPNIYLYACTYVCMYACVYGTMR